MPSTLLDERDDPDDREVVRVPHPFQTHTTSGAPDSAADHL